MTTKEVLTPFLLRSSTPAPNEKVLRYLEGMSKEGEEPDTSPPRSVLDADEFRSKVGSPRARSPQVQSPARSKRNESLLNSPMSHHSRNGGQVVPHDDDADSNAQEGRTSEAGDTMLPAREPGPHDPPGPKYESYDSGPSFGNLGPFPIDDHIPVTTNNLSTWNPDWSQLQSKSPPPPSHSQWNGAANGTEGLQSTQAAKIPLPPSEFAMSPRGTNNEMMSPRRVASPNGKERAMSPSGRSQTSKGRPADDIPTSPRLMMSPRGLRSKAPSISPSDSPSQIRPSQSSPVQQQYRGSSVLSGGAGHQNRPFSPYRHAATQEDLLHHAAVRGRTMVIPEEDEKTSSVAPPNGGAQSKTPSQISKAPSQGPTQLSKTRSQGSSKSPVNGKTASVAASKISEAQSHRTQSHREANNSHDTEHDLDQEEARIVRAALAAATPRTSYYAEPLEPSFSSHYHDMELCVLLHQESDPSVHDVVKRALRKAVVQRVKKLGLKYDQE
ncbi:hypothetical protein H0H93_006951, partial [Arthromyces matolae]